MTVVLSNSFFTPYLLLQLPFVIRNEIIQNTTLERLFDIWSSNNERLYSIPDVFIIQINKVDEKGKFKNKYTQNEGTETIVKNYVVDIPEYFDFSKYCFDTTFKRMYDLYSVVTHTGIESKGHYTSTIKVNGKWYNFDDSIITEVTEGVRSEYVRGGNIYFYRKRNSISTQST
jgi:ubiquitin C-terminal hydrolase